MVNSASLNQVRKFGSLRVKLFEIYDVSQPMGIFLDKFLLLIRIDIFYTKHETNRIGIVNTWVK